MTTHQRSDHALRQAQNPHTAAEILNALGQHEDPQVRLAVSQNPTALGDTLTVLFDDEYAEIGDAARAHPHLPLALLEALEAASDVHTPPARQAVLAEHPAWRVRRELAQAQLTSEALLERLAADPNLYVRITVAGRTGLAPYLAERLSLDPEPQVRYTLLCDESCSDALLERLALDRDERVSDLACGQQRDRRRSHWNEAEAEQALRAGRAGDLDALTDVGIYRLNAALRALPSPSAFFEKRIVMPGSEAPDALREAMNFLLTAASQGQKQAQRVLDELAEARLYTDPSTCGDLYVDLPFRPGVDELLPSRVAVRLQGSLIEDHDYIDPVRAATYLQLLGFRWTDAASIADGFDRYNEDSELDLENLDLERFDLETSDGKSYDPATLSYDFRAGWLLIEALSAQAEDDPHAAVTCIGLLTHFARMGHARSSVVFRALIQLKAEYERGGS